MNNIPIEKLDSNIFSKFGNVLEKKNASELRPINQGTTSRYHNISELDLEKKDGKSGISIFSGLPRELPIEIKIMEKHPVASQSFLPIQDYDWLIVVSEEKNQLPDLNTLRCFHVNGDTGITYNKNVWHHPLLVLKKQDFWIVDRINSKETNNENLVEFHFDENDYAYINLNT